MRIEAYNQVQQLYKSQSSRKTQSSSGSARSTDRVQISSVGKDFQTAKAALADTPDIREELTAPIKAEIQDGTYSVDNETFADKLIRKYEEMR
ncbi:MAG: flagellar biosynthesis anti-sigma factor FlgM [Lachnospiraceae bacterium]|nr:flagellar biosynthesis anti-sigma factor FlgM [Lachnospiraceae bacterium]